MTLSANALFHFTPRREYLLDILTNGFRPHYSLEDLSGISFVPAKMSEVAFPLVSFCDIPLSQTTDHMATYGEYAIGLSKEWAMGHGITPLLYHHKDSPNIKAVRDLVVAGREAVVADHSKGTPVAQFGCFIKAYEGELIRPGKAPRHVRFYNEREWRYVPPDSTKAKIMRRRDWEDDEKRREANLQARELGGPDFAPTDIRYVIVPKEHDRLAIVRSIEEIKSPKYGQDQVRIVASRVLSAEQIRSDF